MRPLGAPVVQPTPSLKEPRRRSRRYNLLAAELRRQARGRPRDGSSSTDAEADDRLLIAKPALKESIKQARGELSTDTLARLEHRRRNAALHHFAVSCGKIRSASARQLNLYQRQGRAGGGSAIRAQSAPGPVPPPVTAIAPRSRSVTPPCIVMVLSAPPSPTMSASSDVSSGLLQIYDFGDSAIDEFISNVAPATPTDHDAIISEFLLAIPTQGPHDRSPRVFPPPHQPHVDEAEVDMDASLPCSIAAPPVPPQTISCGTASTRRRRKKVKVSTDQCVPVEAPTRGAGRAFYMGLAICVVLLMCWPRVPPTLAPIVQVPTACSSDEGIGDYQFAASHALFYASVIYYTAGDWHKGLIEAIEQGSCSGQLFFRVRYDDGDLEHLSEDAAFEAAARAALAHASAPLL